MSFAAFFFLATFLLGKEKWHIINKIMQNRKIKYSLIIILLVISLILAGVIFYAKNQELRVIFLDVGQGDAILLSQGSRQILIDGGPSEQILLEKLGQYVPFWDREIELVIATHPDQDHIQGLLGVMKNYRVDGLVETTVKSESQLDKKFEELLAGKKIAKIKGEAGVTIKLGTAQLDILNPSGETPNGVVKDTNAYSVVAKLVFGQNSFLFTGDLPEKEEAKLLEQGVDLKSTVLKVAHHGSKYATSEKFLEKVAPREAIISVGKNNRFGHPTPETIQRLEAQKIDILRTDEVGDIEYNCAEVESECALSVN